MPEDGSIEPLGVAVVLDVAMKGVGVVWLAPDPHLPGVPPTTGPLWHVWSDGACYLLTGPGEQQLPGITAGNRAQVIVRNAAGGRALRWEADVEILDPAGAVWAAVAPKLAAGRLNGGDPVTVVQTWPGRLTIVCLRPTGALVTPEIDMPDDSGAAPPLPTSATTPYRMPSDITRSWRRRRKAKRASR